MKKVQGLPALILCTWAFVLGCVTNLSEDMDCVHCDVLFSKVRDDNDASSSNRVQHVEMQLRGEMS